MTSLTNADYNKKEIKTATTPSKRELMLAGIILHRNRKFVDLTGRKYGRWLVLKRAPNRGRMVCWECVCECGVVKEIARISLTSHASKSCGCWNLEMISAVDHGMTGTPEYNCWNGIKDRCFREGNGHWKQYGGRGITVCQRWLDNFENFYADMGPRPEGYSIERIDVNGNYEPSNCKWIPAEDQPRNKTTSRRIVALGREQILADWARELGMDVSRLHYLLAHGHTVENIKQSLTIPRYCQECKGEFFSIRDDKVFCGDDCQEKCRERRKLKKIREVRGEMFMVVKGDGDYKRYLRSAEGDNQGYRWIISKMWAGTYTKEESERLASVMGNGSTIEKKGLFVRKEEYPGWKLESRKRNPTFWKPQNEPQQLVLALQ